MSFPKAEQALEALWVQVKAEDKARITGVALLGTGGFRDVARIQRGARTMMRKLERVIVGYKEALGKPADQDWQAVTIEGEEEATFAWLAARELGAKPGHRTIETGGQTCQYALEEGDGWTQDLGTNAVKAWMSEPAFAPCKDKPLGADACIAAFGARFGASRMIIEGPRAHPMPDGAALWAMGGAWENLFIDQAKFAKQPAPAVGSTLKIGQIYALAKQVCSDRPPKYPGDLYEPAFFCMRLSHAVAFAVSAYGGAFAKGVKEAVKQVSAKEVVNGKESFARGAAVSGTLFGECAAARAGEARERRDQ